MHFSSFISICFVLGHWEMLLPPVFINTRKTPASPATTIDFLVFNKNISESFGNIPVNNIIASRMLLSATLLFGKRQFSRVLHFFSEKFCHGF